MSLQTPRRKRDSAEKNYYSDGLLGGAELKLERERGIDLSRTIRQNKLDEIDRGS
jgi:hypothetical protein